MGWKLHSTKSNVLKSKAEQEYDMLVENLDWNKGINSKSEMLKRFAEFERKLREQSELSLK